MPINTSRYGQLHPQVDKSRAAQLLSQRFFHEQESRAPVTALTPGLRATNNVVSVRFSVYILQLSVGTEQPVEWAWLIRALSKATPVF